jgi:hypothetical protein
MLSMHCYAIHIVIPRKLKAIYNRT